MCFMFAAALFSAAASAQFIEVPPLRGRIVDQTGVLSSTAQELETTLEELESTQGSQVVVLMVSTTKPETIEQFSIRVVDQWKLGRKGIDDGVLLLIALQDRAVRIEVGRGLEGDIPDAIAKRIISEQILPHFRRGDMPQGVRAGVVSIVNIINGIELPAPTVSREGDADRWIFLFVAPLVVASYLKSLLGRVAGGLLGLGLGTLGASLMAPIAVALVFGLVCGALVFSLRPEFTQGGGYYQSGGRGRHKGGGFSGGGFSGGGGGFSGGGASGRW